MKIKLINKDLSPNGQIGFLEFKIENNFDYKAWQFVMLEVDSKTLIEKINIDLSEEERQKILSQSFIKRAYSIASNPYFTKQNWIISFYVKKAWVFSTFLIDNLQVGEEINLIWPYGHFTDEWKNKKYLFISVGSGLAPILSLYDQLKKEWNFDKIVNIHWDRFLDNIPSNILSILKENNDKIKNLIFLSRDENVNDWFLKGHVQDWLNKALEILNDKNISVFICYVLNWNSTPIHKYLLPKMSPNVFIIIQ